MSKPYTGLLEILNREGLITIDPQTQSQQQTQSPTPPQPDGTGIDTGSSTSTGTNTGKKITTSTKITTDTERDTDTESDATTTTTNAATFSTALSSDTIPFDTLAAILQTHYNIPYFDLPEREPQIDASAVALLNYGTAIKYNAIPVSVENGVLYIAMQNPFDIAACDDIYIITGHHVRPLLSKSRDIRLFINKYYSRTQIRSIASEFIIEESLKKNPYALDDRLKADISNAPAVKLIDSLIEAAVLYNASDIHIEPYENEVRTRYRIDGVLTEFQTVGVSLLPNIIARIKIMGGMDISEKRLPQDGHFKIDTVRAKIDFRISTIPAIHGEKAVIRLIYGDGARIGVERLGFLADDLRRLTGLFKSFNGAVLVTGPTGSGKTTTLAGFLNLINTGAVNIVTAEDPVENVIYGVNQININPKTGLTFANALRSILRQDPDVIMIGEIRDEDTAAIAVRAAITGHLVLSTLHTNDAAGAVIRLMDMGVAHYLVTAAIKGIISQRLVRRICPACKKQTPLTGEDVALTALPPDTPVFVGEGCTLCNFTGYRGRFVIYEYVVMDDGLRAFIDSGVSYERLKNYLVSHGFKTIWENAIRNVLDGNTTLTEIYRALM